MEETYDEDITRKSFFQREHPQTEKIDVVPTAVDVKLIPPQIQPQPSPIQDNSPAKHHAKSGCWLRVKKFQWPFRTETPEEMRVRLNAELHQIKTQTEFEILKKKTVTQAEIKKIKLDSTVRMKSYEDQVKQDAYNLAASYSTAEEILRHKEGVATDSTRNRMLKPKI